MTVLFDAADTGGADLTGSGGGGFDFLSSFANADLGSLDIFGGGAPIVAPTLNLPSTGAGMTDVFRNIAGLVNVAYQGEAMVQQGKLQNRIAAARLDNQLQTIRTTPNIWLVLGIAGAGFFALELMDRKKR